jgi:hypothetical protein
MTKSKTFWLAAALVSFCAAGFCGYSIYNRLTLHFAKDTLEIRPVPVPIPGAAWETKPEAAAKTEETPKTPASKEDPQKVKAVKTHFEYTAPAARSVSISGSFTSWKEVKMSKKNSVWNAEVYILPGNYLYHFTVDGKKTLDAGKPRSAVGESIIEVKQPEKL